MTGQRTDAYAATGTWILAATILASSMVFIDSTAVNVALPILQRELHASIADAQWFVEAYALFLSALILVGGSLGDHFGRRRVFLIGVIGFAIASAVCGFAHNSPQLVFARAAQGAASALMTPGSLSIISASFQGAARGSAIGVWSSATAITAAVGPVLGGFIVEHASWRWIFFINIPLAVATVIIGLRFVPESHDDEKRHHIDWLGATVATCALGAMVYAMIVASVSGWTGKLTGILIAGIILLGCFVLVEREVRRPMMPLSLFENRTFAAINLLTLLLYGALGGALFFLPFNLIQVHHYTPTAAGAALLPFIGLIFALSPWAGTLVTKVGAKVPLTIGTFLSTLGLAGLALAGTDGSYWLTFFPASAVLGLGMSFVVSPLTTTVMGSVDAGYLGVASGVNNAIARTASLIAVAALSLAVVAAFNHGLETRLASAHVSSRVASTVTAERQQLANTKPPSFATPPERHAVEIAVADSYVDGFRIAMLLAAAFALTACACAVLLLPAKVTGQLSTTVAPSP